MDSLITSPPVLLPYTVGDCGGNRGEQEERAWLRDRLWRSDKARGTLEMHLGTLITWLLKSNPCRAECTGSSHPAQSGKGGDRVR